MSGRNVSQIIASAGFATVFLTELVKRVKNQQGTDFDLHHLVTPEGEEALDKIAEIIGTMILFSGALFVFLPHAFHSKLAFQDESHYFHVILGIALMFIGLVILLANQKRQQKVYNKK